MGIRQPWLRGTGQTTRLMEEAISLLAELPQDTQVFVTGAHSQQIMQMEKEFKASGLVDVKFFLADEVVNGCTRGYKAVLLIDDVWDLTPRQRVYILDIQAELRRRYGTNGTPERSRRETG